MKKKLWWILCLSMLMVFGSTLTAHAAGDSIAEATVISLDTTYSGSITDSNTNDYYAFTLNEAGRITLKSTAYISRLTYKIFDEDGNSVWYINDQYWNTTTQKISLSEEIDLTAGTYFVDIAQSWVDYSTGSYSLKIAFTSAEETIKDTGDNNSTSGADVIELAKTYHGQIAENDGRDYYAFTLSKDTLIRLRSTAYFSRLTYAIYDEDGSTVWYENDKYWNTTSEKITLNETIELSAGTYFLKVAQSWVDYSTGNYSIKINKAFTKSNVTLSTTTYTYSGKTKTPSVKVKNLAGTTLKKGTDYTLTWSSSSRKSIGKYTVTIKGKGDYAGTTVKKTFKIKPKQVSVKSVKSSSSKKLTVKWSKVSGSVKYQVAYKVKGGSWKYKTVSSKTYSKTITGLKSGKTYYIKVRAVKTVDSTKYYGSWSSTTKVKVK